MKKIITTVVTLSMFITMFAVPAKMTSMTPLIFCSQDEYQAFINETNLPDNFVYYDSVKFLGRSHSLNFVGMFAALGYDPERMQYGGYEYNIEVEKKDPSSYYGGYWSFRVRPEYDEIDTQYALGDSTPFEFKNDTDDLSGGYKDGYYDFNGFVYRYSGNCIYAISWENDGILYSIYPNIMGNVFTPDSIVGKLLNKNTAPEVIEMLKTYNFTKKPAEPPETADMTAIFPIMSVICAGGFTLFAVRRKREN